MPELFLVVNGQRYTGWKSIRVTLSMESIAGQFALEVSDRWASNEEPWPIAEEDACRVEIDRNVVIDGHVDVRDLSMTARDLGLAYEGRDRAGALVDNSVVGVGTYRNVDALQFARAIAEPFGIRVSKHPDLTLTKIPKIVIAPGTKCFPAIAEACERSGILAVSDARGGVVLTRRGRARAASLIQGVNVMGARARFDASSRFRRYLISSQIPGTDEAFGDATHAIAEAQDLGVRRTERVLLIRPDKGYNAADARRRADWEARVRAARAEAVTVTVQGWYQPGTTALWPINSITSAIIPRVGIGGDMLISQVVYTVDNQGGSLTELTIMRPDAFEPEPQATVKDPVGLWKELERGAR